MDDQAIWEEMMGMATERARQRLGSAGVPDPEEAIDAARWALMDLIMPRPSRAFNLDPAAFERGVQEVARRLTER